MSIAESLMLTVLSRSQGKHLLLYLFILWVPCVVCAGPSEASTPQYLSDMIRQSSHHHHQPRSQIISSYKYKVGEKALCCKTWATIELGENAIDTFIFRKMPVKLALVHYMDEQYQEGTDTCNKPADSNKGQQPVSSEPAKKGFWLEHRQ